MKKFHFRLGRLLTLKTTLEHHQSLTCRRLEMAVRQSMQDKLDLETKVDLMRMNAASQPNGAIDVSKMQSVFAYLDVLDESIKRKKMEIFERQKTLSDARNELMERMQERKILERMKERMLLVYRKDLEKQFQQQLDDHPGGRNHENDWSGDGENPSHSS